MTRQVPDIGSVSEAFPEFSSRFEILKKLGEGGAAVVYQVLDQKEDRVKALKALKPALLGNQSALGRFEDEFRILRRLRHPGLPEMFDYGVAGDGTRYMVMEYIEGKPLDEYVRRHPEELRLLLFEITEALQFIHEFKLLHFDLKPENILVHRTTAAGDETPQIVLIDFGLSLQRSGNERATVSGTPAYMAPEIIEQRGQPTRAVDYYSLGVILFELVEGRLPFEGSVSEVLRAHLYKEVRFEKQLVEYTDLYPYVVRLMSKDPDSRLEGFEEFRRMLAAKVSEEASALEKIYGLGYIESLGMIGKQELWNNLQNWIKEASATLPGRLFAQATSEAQEASGSSTGMIPEGGEGGQRKSAGTLVITGPSRSGKSFLMEAYRGECLLNGLAVWVLGEGGDYESLVSENPFGKLVSVAEKPTTIDPRAFIIDRFVRGWERLKKAGERGGVVLIIDGYDSAGEEERGFLEYVGKRLDLVLGEGLDPNVYIAATGRSPRLMKELEAILPKEQKMKEYIIPLPGKNDIESILNGFHGRMAGKDDRMRLGEYLAQNSSSSGKIAESMRSAVVRGEMVRESGRWRFIWTTRRNEAKGADRDNYYQLLLADLSDREREILSWLCCHPGSLEVELFETLSGETDDELRASIERLKPFRLLELTRESGREYIGIRNEAAAGSLYQGVAGDRRKYIHGQYIEQYRILLREHSKIDTKEYARLREMMAFHYNRIGDRRSALLMRIQAVRSMKKTKDIFGLRRVCEGGIQEARSLNGRAWRGRKWDIERYFIRELVNAEWMVEDYRGIIRVVRDHLIKRKKAISLGIIYKYGTALRWAGDYAGCLEVVRSESKKLKIKSKQYQLFISLLKSALLNNQGKYSKSIKLLNSMPDSLDILNDRMKCTIQIYYILNYLSLGIHGEFLKHSDYLYNFAREHKLNDELLFAQYYKIDQLFNNARYLKAKEMLRSSIRLATKKKVYYRLSNMYNLLSGVYFEEGLYHQAIKHMRNSKDIATSLGILKWAIDCRLKLSYNYERTGEWGNSIRQAKYVVNAAERHSWNDLKFNGTLQLFNMYTLINHPIKKEYLKRCSALIRMLKSTFEEANFNYYLGEYHLRTFNLEKALEAFGTAEKLFHKINFGDDAIRSSIKIAYTFLLSGKIDEYREKEKSIKKGVTRMESEEIVGEYLELKLKFSYLMRETGKELEKRILECERQIGRINNINILMNISLLLFRANARIGKIKRSMMHYRNYHNKLKFITNQMGSGKDTDYYINSGECEILRDEFIKLLKRSKKTEPLGSGSI